MWSPGILALCLAVGMAGASGAAWYVQEQRWSARHESEMRRMLQAGVDATNKRGEEIAALKEKSLEDSHRIADATRNARVRCYSTSRVPASGVRTDADTLRDDRETGEASEDILRQCLRTFREVNRNLGAPP